MAHLHKTSDDFADKTQNSIDMKSAVISGAFEGLSKDEIDKFYTQNLSEVQSFKPKKGSFQITSVTSGNNVTRDDDPGEDSQDDLDDTHTYTEDNMSMDWSRHTDLEADRGLLIEQEEPHDDLTLHRPVPKTSDAGQSVKERSSTDNQSRFRVVKIVTHEPFKRGRWTCFDFLQDPNKPNPDNVNLDFKESKDHVVVTGSETSSAASSIHYVHGQDDPAKNPLNAQPLTQTLTSPIYFDDKHQPQINPVLNGQENFDHLEPSNTGVKTPESFPTTNGNGPYVSQPPVHQASMPPSLTTIVGNSSMTHTSATNQPSQVASLAHGSLGLPTTEAALSNVLSSGYAREPGGGVYGAELSHSTPRTASRAMNIDRPSSRTHRISIGGEELEVSDDFGAGNLLEQIAGKPGALASPTKENDGEDSGPNSVAIDNKIEQAMDLVKSHLMFAVREEVEVLKEQINDLEEAKRKLEFENTVLKAAASAETLAKLAQAQQQNPLAPT